jgi:hypothetical protein
MGEAKRAGETTGPVDNKRFGADRHAVGEDKAFGKTRRRSEEHNRFGVGEEGELVGERFEFWGSSSRWSWWNTKDLEEIGGT